MKTDRVYFSFSFSTSSAQQVRYLTATLRPEATLRPTINDELEDIGPRIVASSIEVELAANDLVEINFSVEDVSPVKSGPASTRRADRRWRCRRASLPCPGRRQVMTRDYLDTCSASWLHVLARRQHEASPFESDVLHGRRPGIAIIGGRRNKWRSPERTCACAARACSFPSRYASDAAKIVSKTGMVDPSPKPQISRSPAVGISLRCLPIGPARHRRTAACSKECRRRAQCSRRRRTRRCRPSPPQSSAQLGGTPHVPPASDEVRASIPPYAVDELPSLLSEIDAALDAFRKQQLHPRVVEEILGITASERRRWTKDGRLPQSGSGSFRRGQSIHFALHPAAKIAALARQPATIEAWRIEDEKRTSASETQDETCATRKRSVDLRSDITTRSGSHGLSNRKIES